MPLRGALITAVNLHRCVLKEKCLLAPVLTMKRGGPRVSVSPNMATIRLVEVFFPRTTKGMKKQALSEVVCCQIGISFAMNGGGADVISCVSR